MNQQEFAAYVSVSMRTLEELMREQAVSCVRLWGRVRLTEAHAVELLAKFETKARAQSVPV